MVTDKCTGVYLRSTSGFAVPSRTATGGEMLVVSTCGLEKEQFFVVLLAEDEKTGERVLR